MIKLTQRDVRDILPGDILSNRDLRGINFRNCELDGVEFNNSLCQRANFRGANIAAARFKDSNCTDAIFANANASEISFEGATLKNVDFRGANLYMAYFGGAQCKGANFKKAILAEADLSNAINFDPTGIILPITVPSTGDLIGYKKCRYNYIVTLLIPDGIRRHNATSTKCRAEAAVVIDIRDEDGNPQEIAYSNWDNGFCYNIGEWVEPRSPFEKNRWDECASGIHFFLTADEAKNY